MRLCLLASTLAAVAACAPTTGVGAPAHTTGAVLPATSTTVPSSRGAPHPADRRGALQAEAIEERDAAAVFRSLHPDLVRCLDRSNAARRGAHAYLIAEVLVGPSGEVREVSTTGGADVGARTMTCIERRLARASFRPPRLGGTRRVSVPFTFEVGDGMR